MVVHDVKITVVKKLLNPEVLRMYARRGSQPSCESVEVGMEFLS